MAAACVLSGGTSPPPVFYNQDNIESLFPCSSCRGLSPFCRKCRKRGRARSGKHLGIRASNIPLLPQPVETTGTLFGLDAETATPASTSTSRRPESTIRLSDAGKICNRRSKTRRVHAVDHNGTLETTQELQAGSAADESVPPASARSGSPVGSIVSTAAPANVERLRQERQQFLEWGESLLNEVGLLEQEKAELQASLDQASRRCSELERLVRQGVAQSGAAVATAEENEGLRKQLSAYAVEIDVLREEREQLQNDLSQARDKVQQISAERDELVASKKQEDKREPRFGTDSTESIAGTTADLEASAKSVETTEPEGQESAQRPSISELVECIKQIKRAHGKLQEEYVQQTLAFTKFYKEVRAQQNMAQLHFNNARQHFNERMQSAVADEHSMLVREAEQARGQLAASQILVDSQQEELARLKQPQLDRNRDRHERLQKTPALRVIHRCLQYNIAWEMASALQGFILEKVHENRAPAHGPRFVRLHVNWDRTAAGFGLSELQLKWTKPTGHEKLTSDIRREKRERLTPEQRQKLQVQRLTALPDLHPRCVQGAFGYWTTSLDLYTVIRIDYGLMNRACALSDEDPWRCFSLYTLKRSYDFICPDEQCAQCFILAISRLAPWASGAIKTRKEFLARKGWCKVESHCHQEDMTIPQAVRAALQASLREDGPQRPTAAAPPASAGDVV